MYYMKDGKPVAVLNDFDLATTGEGPTGTERTGTIPFMALALLGKKGIQGKIKHVYEHDAQSFIWVLTWICLRYSNEGKLPSGDRQFDNWLKVDAEACREKKSGFLFSQGLYDLKPGAGHETNWEAALKCLDALRGHVNKSVEPSYQPLAVDAAFTELLAKPITPFLE
jgi:hypothetical protein